METLENSRQNRENWNVPSVYEIEARAYRDAYNLLAAASQLQQSEFVLDYIKQNKTYSTPTEVGKMLINSMQYCYRICQYYELLHRAFFCLPESKNDSTLKHEVFGL
jgi:hypothetical protein